MNEIFAAVALVPVTQRLDKIITLLEQGEKQSQPSQVCNHVHYNGGSCLRCGDEMVPQDSKAQLERDELIEEIVKYYWDYHGQDFMTDFRQFLKSKLK